MAACQRYLEKAPRDFITFEYVMLDGINDRPSTPRQLLELVRMCCKFNLIPFNPFPNSGYDRSSNNAIRIFREMLQEQATVTVRKPAATISTPLAGNWRAGDGQDPPSNGCRSHRRMTNDHVANVDGSEPVGVFLCLPPRRPTGNWRKSAASWPLNMHRLGNLPWRWNLPMKPSKRMAALSVLT
jgi:hypothetical protein